MKIAFVTDTGTGQHPDYWKEKGIYCLPLQITCDEESKDEYTEITYSEVIQKLHEKKVLRTSLPSLGKIQDCFKELKNEGYDTIFAVPICRGLSGTLDSMEMIANQLEMKFVGVDCYCTAVEQGCMIEAAKKMYEANIPIDEIIKKLQNIADSCETVLLCDDLDHMKRGGRLTPMAAALGGLLKIKPVLHIDKSTNRSHSDLGAEKIVAAAKINCNRNFWDRIPLYVSCTAVFFYGERPSQLFCGIKTAQRQKAIDFSKKLIYNRHIPKTEGAYECRDHRGAEGSAANRRSIPSARTGAGAERRSC